MKLLIMLILTTGFLFSHATLDALTQNDKLTSFYCGNHEPSHFAKDGTKIKPLTEEFDCSNWTSVDLGTISGTIKAGGDIVIGASISMLSNDGKVIGGGVTDDDGNFTISEAPKAGTYQFKVNIIGFSEKKIILDLSKLDLESWTIDID